MKLHIRRTLACSRPSIFARLIVALALLSLCTKAHPQGASSEQIDRQVNALLRKLSLQQKIKLIGGVDNMFTYAMPSIGLPRLKMSDGPMGVRTWGPDTAYAAGIGLAASWDPALARLVGIALGRDARARGVNFLLGPGVDIYREPMNGRNFEYFGEDPYLASHIAVSYIEGVQSQDVVATVKHYAMNNSEYDRHNENSIVAQRAMHEIYFPAYEAAVKQAHVGAVMDSYNLINGEHATQNKFLDTDVLKKEWGFQGILMSDWGATYNGVAAANAGLDLEMPSAEFMNLGTLLPAIRSGKVSEATIDDKVRRILRIALRFGFLNHNQTDLGIPLYDQVSRDTALRSAEESVVLLKNQGNLLPLHLGRIHSIALIGPDAYPAQATAGGSANVTPFNAVSFLAGLSDTLGMRVKVYWSRGVEALPTIFGEGTEDESSFDLDEQGKHPGLRQEVFQGGTFAGQPVAVNTVMRLNSFAGSQWAPSAQQRFAYRYTGYYIPKVSGPQRFIAASVGPDTYNLYVNHRLVLEEKQHEGQSPQWVDVDLPAGQPVSVRFDYVPDTSRIRVGLGALPAADMLEPDVKRIASMADVAVVSVGFSPETESEGHDRTWRLPAGQDELIKSVLAANPRTVVVVTSGGSIDTSQWIVQTPALIQDWYGGSEGGRALADVLLGRVDPSGKLPISWEKRKQNNPCYHNYYEQPGTHDVKYAEGIFLGYRYYDRSKVKPLFPFGFGLSYTTFALSDLHVTPSEANPDGSITVSFNVRNSGERAGAEVAQVYVGDPSAAVPRPVKELKGFERVFLKPGQTEQVSLKLNRRSLAYWDVRSGNWKVDSGKFVVYVGDSSENVPLRATFTVR
jgi:beta-glucosidase